MGANAVTTVYDFTAGQVLTAAQMDNVNCGIPVFATTTTRDAAFGGTGEKTLAEGQFAYIEDTNTTQYYDGAAWQPVGASGLTLISSTTVGNAVSSVTVSNCFSATYKAYKILFDGGTASAQCDLLGQLSGITSNYYVGIPIVDVATNGTGSYNVNNGSTFWVGFGSTNSTIANIDIHNPFATQYKYGSINVYIKQGTNNAGNGYISCVSNTSASGFVLSPSTGTITGGTIRVYGYANS